MKSILSNFIQHETVVCDSRGPSWINGEIKYLIQERNIVRKRYFQTNEDIQLFKIFQCIQNLLTVTVEKSKEEFFLQS